MSLKTRRFIFIFFVISFLTIAPLSAFYAAGYKIKLSWPIKLNQTFQKTGMFIFDTQPDGAKIYLNDNAQQLFFKKILSKEKSYIKTPAKVKNLASGEYSVRLEKDGYWPWQKKLTIYPGQSTYAEDINLFKKNNPLKIISGNFFEAQNSPNKKYLALENEEKIIIFNQDNEKINEIPILQTSNKEKTKILWSPNSKKIIAGNIIIDIDNINNPIYINDLIGKNIENPKWDINDPNKIYYKYKNSINSFDLSRKENKILAKDQEYLDFLIKNEYIFFLTQINKITKLKTISLKTNELMEEIDLPCSSEYELINSNHNLINLHDKKHDILYLIEPFSQTNHLKEIINNIKYTNWIDDKKLLYANDFEILIYEVNSGKKTLLTRISNEITGLSWHPNNNYIIYSTDLAINTIELDEREKRNITELIKMSKISSLSLNQKGDILYFNAKMGTQEGLYKLAIQ